MRQKQVKWHELDVRIGKRWRVARKKLGLSLDEVCANMKTHGFNISRSGLANFETGNGQPLHVQVLISLLCYLYKTEPNLIYGDE